MPSTLVQLFWAVDGNKVREDTQSIFPENLKVHELTAYNGSIFQKWEYGQESASEWQAMTGVPNNYLIHRHLGFNFL